MQKCSTTSAAENKCPKCNGTGWEEVIVDGVPYLRECKCGKIDSERLETKLNFAEIPKSFQNMTMSNFNTAVYLSPKSRDTATLAVKGIKYWLSKLNIMQERGMGLYLYSNAKGSGKTRMAASIANELIGKGVQVKFATSLQILSEIKSSWDKENEYNESKLLNDLSRTEVLIIDDFGTEQAKDWINERFYQIINNRYIDKKITIFTSNQSLGTIKYDDRITNRIKERTFQIPFPEESVRDIIAKNNMKELINGIKEG